jgi:hypothetical protein
MNTKAITNQVFKQFPELQELDPEILEMIVEYIIKTYTSQTSN